MKYRTTEKRRDEIAAPAIVARITILRRDCMLSAVLLDIFGIGSILFTKVLFRLSIEAAEERYPDFLAVCRSYFPSF